MKLKYLGREVEVLNIQFGSDPVDTYIEKAEFTDDDTTLSDDQLDVLQIMHADSLYTAWYEYQQDRAESMSDMDR